MHYQVIFKQYNGSLPVKEEGFQLPEGSMGQVHQLKQFPCKIQYVRRSEGKEERFQICAEMTGQLDEPVSIALELVKEDWTRKEYVFLPAAVYNGNRAESKYLPYPPYHIGETDGKWDCVITDIPHLSKENSSSIIQLRSGDMSTPSMGYWDMEQKEGVLMLAKHKSTNRYTGFTVSENENTAAFRISCPAVREGTKYFFGELSDGSGFYPTTQMPSDDCGMILKEGEKAELEVRIFRFPAEDLTEYFMEFNTLRNDLEKGSTYFSIPFSTAYTAVKEKYTQMNFTEEGYYRVGTDNEAPPSFWQAGWIGGGMNTWPFLQEDTGLAHNQALATLTFITKNLQLENGWYLPMYAKAKAYGDDFEDTNNPVLLVRKTGDLLYFLLKQAMYLKNYNKLPEGLEESIARQSNALVRFYRKNGQLGQFINMQEDTLLQGDTACGAITPAALALAYEYFENREYLETAEALGNLYWHDFLKKGMLNGGPGEICQAPDSESAFAFLESCIQLYETTGNNKWLEASKEAFELAITWVVSYDFEFPPISTAAKMGMHAAGTIFANAQNKHSAPGICTLSGNSMLKLYRFTGNTKYLQWMQRICHALSQFVSLPDRQINTLSNRALPAGYFNERVQTSDWEGKKTIGEFLYGSNWPEVSMLLTYVEIPGIYIDLDRDLLVCCDHLQAKMLKYDKNSILLEVYNPTPYNATVTLLVDRSKNGSRLGHLYYDKMEKFEVIAGMMLKRCLELKS